MAGPIEIIITQGGSGGGANYGSPTLNAVYGGSQSGGGQQQSVGRGRHMIGEEEAAFMKKDTAFNLALATAALKVAEKGFNLGVQIMKNQVSLQAKRSGDYISSQDQQLVIDMSSYGVNKAFKAGGLILGGMAVGSIIPGAGTVAGGMLGATVFAASEAFEIAGKVTQAVYDVQSRLLDYQMMATECNRNRERAGMVIASNSRDTRY